MRDLTLLSKLLAEEDIHVVHRNQSTAAFDVLNRELSLPIWKDMSKTVQELMTLHEVGHALWTPLEMMDKVKEEKIDFSVVNVLEDVRIEKAVQIKYKGAIKIFDKGYQELINGNFFETIGKDINKYNLIDRINLHYKHHSDIPFSDDEMVWVKKANQTITSDDVIELAKELVEYIKENPDSQGQKSDDDLVMDSMGQPSMNNNGGQEESDDGQEIEVPSSSASEEKEEEKSEGSEKSDGQTKENTEEENSTVDSTETKNTEENSDDKSASKEATNGNGVGDDKTEVTASTDKASEESMKKMLDTKAGDYSYSNIPKADLEKIIVPSKKILEIFSAHYLEEKKHCGKYWNKTLEELNKTKSDSKKAVSYMVKEFEMKKAADAYSRATISKTGTLDMGKLHTYKYNDDLFAKVTTLPGAKNHGLVLFLDWSGSMAHNLLGTMNQLFNIIWFCNRTQIPFEVYGFSNGYDRTRDTGKFQNFKSGDMVLNVNLLQLFSSKMKTQEQNDMMHYLYMFASRWGFRNWRDDGYPYQEPRSLQLASTPLNDAIICAMDLVPQFKKTTGVQKIHTIFLTDGASNNIYSKFHVHKNEDGSIHNGYKGLGYGTQIFTDVKFGNKVSSKDKRGSGVQTEMLLSLLKQRMPDMNIVNFYVAGTGRKGTVNYNSIRGIIGYESVQSYREMLDLVKKCNKENVLIVPKGQGFDVCYILPGPNKFDMNTELELEDGVTYNKGQLKRAFSKMSNGKITNRPLLNNFIKMVA